MSNTESFAARPPRGFARAYHFAIAIAATLLFGGGTAAAAATYTLNGTATSSWSLPSNWTTTGPAGSYPGQSAGDVVILDSGAPSAFTLNVDVVVPNAVTLQDSGLGTTVSIPAGSQLTLDPSSTVTSGNAVSINGGVLQVATGGTFSPAGNVTLNSGQLTLAGGYSTVSGSTFAFHGGTIAGPGTLTIANTSSFDGSSGNMSLTGGAIVQVSSSGGIVSYSSSAGSLSVNSGSHIQVAGTFNFGSSSPAIGTDNAGGAAIDVLSGGTFFAFGSGMTVQATLNNAGTVTTSGFLTLAGGGTHGGKFDAPNSLTSITFSGNHKFGSGTTFTTGIAVPAYSFTGATSNFDISSSITIPNFAWRGGTIGSSGAGVLTVGGTFQLDASAAPLTLNSTLAVGVAGANTFVTYIPGSPGLTINGQLVLANTSPYGSSLSLPDTSVIAGTGSISIGAAATLDATGTVSIAPAVNIGGPGGLLVIDPAGVLTLSGGGSITSAGSMIFSSSTLKLTGGTFTAADTPLFSASGGTLDVAGGTLALSAASSPLLPTLQVDSGAVRLLTAGENLSMSLLVWNGGSFIAPAGVTGAGVTIIDSTTMPAPAGVATVDNITFTNNGTFTFSNPTFGMRLQNAAVFQNNNLFDCTTGGTIASDITSVFKNGVSNAGVVQMSGGTTTQFFPQFQQTFSGSTVTSVSLPSGSIVFSGGGFISAGTAMSTSDAADTINFNGSMPFVLQGGTLVGPGAFVVAGGGVVNIAGPVSLNAPLQNSGTILYTSSAPLTAGAVSIVNQTSGVFDIQTDTALSGTSSTFNNAGTLKKTAGSGIMQFDPLVTNSGSILAQSGTLSFTGNVVQNSPGITTLGAGSIRIGGGSGSFTLNGGSLTGSGTLTGNVIANGGAVAPGTTGATGAISVSGNYTQGASGALLIKLAGNLSGQYDTVAVSGTATLNGLLDVMNLGSWTPLAGDNYTFMTFGSNSGTTFASTSLPSSSFGVNYLPSTAAATSAVLTVTGTDLAVLQSAPTAVFHGQNATITVTVTNNGPASATGVTLTDTFSGPASFVSATSTVGTCSGSAPVTCTIGNLAPTGTATVTLTLGTTGTGTIVNGGFVSGTEPDPTPANNTLASASITVNPSSDLSLSLTGPSTMPAGTATYTATVANAGPDASSTSYSLSLSLVGGTITSTTGGLTCTPTSGAAMTCSGPALTAPSGTAALTVNATATGPTMSLTGTLTSTDDPSTSNNGPLTVTTTTTASTDLAVTQSAPASVLHGQNAVITLTVTNNGPSSATGVTLDDTFSGPATLVSATSTAGTCSGSAPVTCTIGNLAPSGTATVTITLATTATGTIVNGGSVVGNEPDPTSANNTAASASIAVNPSSDLSLSLTGPATMSGTATYTATITNAGPDASSTAYSLSLSLTGGTITGTTGGLTCTPTSGTAMTCSGPALTAPGGSAALTINATASGPTMVLTGTLAYANDPNTSNNGPLSVTTGPTASTDLAVTQSAPASVVHGQNAAITLTVANNGPSSATGVTLTDTFSGPATLVSATSTVGTCSGSAPVTCTIGNLAATGTATITITLATTAPGTIVNGASVAGNESDPTPANNTAASASIAVNASSDLSLSLTGPTTMTGSASYTATITNAGPDASSTAYSLSLSLTGGTIASTSGGLTCTPASGTAMTCSGPALAAPGGTAALTVNATATTSTMVLSGTLTYANDPNTSNNGPVSVTTTTTTAPATDVAITQAAPASIIHGSNATIVVTVSNNGPATASGVVVTDTFTTGTLVSVTPSVGSCSGSGPITCSLGSLVNSGTATITVVLTPPLDVPEVNTATVSSSGADSNPTNNTSQAKITVNAASDLSLTTPQPPPSVKGGINVQQAFTVANNGPDPSGAYQVSFNVAGATLLSMATCCESCTLTQTTAFCSGGGLLAGASRSLMLSLLLGNDPTATVTGTVASAGDVNSSNNTATARFAVTPTTADVSVAKSGPQSAQLGSDVTYTIVVRNSGPAAASGVVLIDPLPAGLTLKAGSITGATCADFPCAIQSIAVGATVTVTATYTVNPGAPAQIQNSVAAFTASQDPNPSNNGSSAFTTITGCGLTPPTPNSPSAGQTVSSPAAFSWTAVTGATQYELFLSTPAGPQSAGKSTTNSLSNVTVPNGPFSWYVVVTVPNCESVQSVPTNVTGCNAPPAPVVSLVANANAGQAYTLQWQPADGATSYEVQEATVASFADATTQTVSTRSVAFNHPATANAQPFFYRVRGLAACTTPPQVGPYSLPLRTVVLPELSGDNLKATVPAGTTSIVLLKVFVPGQPDGSYSYSATVDAPWLSIDHPTGTLPPAGITLGVLADPSKLPNGTFTGTVTVTLSPLVTSNVHAQGALTLFIPVSLSLVTPLTPVTRTPPAPDAMIIPSVGHLEGISSSWQSDVRLANVGASTQQYALTFTPMAATAAGAGSMSTTVTIAPGATTALDDVVRNWYGVGSLGEASNGVLEISPLAAAQKENVSSDAVTPSHTTIVSSRTYGVSATGTRGQYIPAVPFSSFIGRATDKAPATVLSLQHIAQSDAYRTNVGVVEAAGAAATVTLSVYDSTGRKLTDYALNLQPYQQVQLNSFLASQNITLTDGRIEAKVTGGEGKVTAYASVVDNASDCPWLVSGVPIGQKPSSRWIVPGVAALNTGAANWQSDVRIFNGGAAPQSASLSLYPLNGGAPLTASTTINPNEVKVLNGVVQTLFGQSNAGGALHVTTTGSANLVVSGRTYNSTPAGTYGQFIPAVTPDDAVGAGGAALNILQVEDSPRYRTNFGIAEVTGKPATARITVYLPDSRKAAMDISLGAFEYRQLPIVQVLGLGYVYNARINVQVISGDGKVTAYGSVIDQSTQDPTYVPAQ